MRMFSRFLLAGSLLIALPMFAESYYTPDPAAPPQDQGGDTGSTSGGKKFITCTATSCEDEVLLLKAEGGYEPWCGLVMHNASCTCKYENGQNKLEGTCTWVKG